MISILTSKISFFTILGVSEDGNQAVFEVAQM
jgi:hypothetical protein